MNMLVAIALSLVLVSLAAAHVYWAALATAPGRGFVPESGGKPLFTPSRAVTLAVAAALLVAAYVAASRGALFHPAPRGSITHWLALAAALAFLLRAVGEFRYVGFFKRHRGTRFAYLDTWLFSPLCVAIGAAFLFVATRP
jgi:hypothetical protein